MLQAEDCNFIKKEALAQVFSCEFWEISKNTKFNQLNGAGWILPGELSSVLCVCEYFSKPSIRITTVKGVSTIEGIETM